MFAALVRTRIAALNNMWFAGLRSKTKGKGTGFKVLMGFLAVYVVGCFIFMFGGLFSAMTPLGGTELSWLYFALVFLVSFALCFIGSVFTAQKQLFDAKDNDLLLAMPIPPRYILGSRMLMLIALCYVFELLVAGPAGVVWLAANGASVRGVVVYVVFCLLMPFFAMTFSCLFGWIMQQVMSRVRNKSLVTTILSVAFLAAYFYLFSNMENYISAFVANGAQIARSISGWAYPACAFGRAVTQADMASTFGYIACCVVPFVIVYIILTLSFVRVSTAKRGAAKIVYRERAAKQRGADMALTIKELRRVSSNGMLLMNTAIGGIFTIALAVMLVISRDKILAFSAILPQIGENLGVFAAVALGFCAASNLMSSSSVSLEGRNLWVTRSMPVESGTILLAKAKAHVLMTYPPVVLAAIVAAVVLPVRVVDIIIMLALPFFLTEFTAKLGVVINLHFPRLDYTSEVAVVKQSASTMIAMLIGWASAALPLAGAFLLGEVLSPLVFAAIYTALLAVADVLLTRYLKTGGARLFEGL